MIDHESITYLLGGALEPYVDAVLNGGALVLAIALLLGAQWIGEAVADRLVKSDLLRK